MANKNRQKRAARKARQARRQEAQATQEAQLAASEKSLGKLFGLGGGCDKSAKGAKGAKDAKGAKGAKGAVKDVKAGAKESIKGADGKSAEAPEKKSVLDHPLTKEEKKEAKKAAAKAKKQAKIQKRRDKKISLIDKKIAAAQKEVQKTKVEQEKTARILREEKEKGTPSKKAVKAAAMAEVQADDALGRLAKLEDKKKEKAKNLSLWRRFVRVLSNIKSEMKRVSWPTRKELRNYTIAVIVLLIIFGLIVWAIDLGVVKGLVKFDDIRSLIGS